MKANSSFITNWMMGGGRTGGSPNSVDWDAGMYVWRDPFPGSFNQGNITIARCNASGIWWEPCGEESLGGVSSVYNGPDTYIWFRHKTTGKEMGGFLDHWTLDRPRFRDFNNITGGWNMNRVLLVQQSSHVMFGLSGRNGTKCSSWTPL